VALREERETEELALDRRLSMIRHAGNELIYLISVRKSFEIIDAKRATRNYCLGAISAPVDIVDILCQCA
jgi:hypothetical protein